MKRDISLWQFGGFAFTSIAGTLLHFLYEWTNENKFAALISGVNESTWEHMKLLFFPLFIFAVVQSYFFKDYKNFWCIKLRGIVMGIIMIPILFYTYNGAIGKSPDWVNIAIFFISAAIVFIFETHLFKKGQKLRCISPKLSFIVICIIGILFMVFTFFTPPLLLFKDPV